MEIVVHRGANRRAPENTIASAEACVALGVDYVEIDIWKSRDGVHYILHDPTLDRTTDGTGPIALRRSGYVDRLDAGSWFSPEFAGERVPRLDAFLDWARDRVKVFLDVKTGNLRRIVSMIRLRGMEDRVFFWFWSDRLAARFRRIAPEIPLKMNSRNAAQVREQKARFDHQIVEHGPNDNSADVIAACRESGIRVMAAVFGTDSPELRRRYQLAFDLGYDMINLDDPDSFLSFRDDHSR